MPRQPKRRTARKAGDGDPEPPSPPGRGPRPQSGARPEAYPEVMTLKQTARYLQLHPQVLYRHVRAGTLPASRIGRIIRFKKSVLNAFLEESGWATVNEFLAFKKRRDGETARRERGRKRQRFSMELD